MKKLLIDSEGVVVNTIEWQEPLKVTAETLTAELLRSGGQEVIDQIRAGHDDDSRKEEQIRLQFAEAQRTIESTHYTPPPGFALMDAEGVETDMVWDGSKFNPPIIRRFDELWNMRQVIEDSASINQKIRTYIPRPADELEAEAGELLALLHVMLQEHPDNITQEQMNRMLKLERRS